MDNEEYQEYKQGLYEAIEDCESHLLLAVQDLGSYREFADLKYDIALILNEAKGMKKRMRDD